MTSISKNVYIEKSLKQEKNATILLIEQQKNTPVDVKPDISSDFDNHNNTRKPKYKVGDLVRISSYKTIDSKSYQLNQTEKMFLIRTFKNTTAQKRKFSIKDFHSKCGKIYSFLQIFATFSEETLNGKLNFLPSF